jgi:hypothetical protein
MRRQVGKEPYESETPVKDAYGESPVDKVPYVPETSADSYAPVPVPFY